MFYVVFVNSSPLPLLSTSGCPYSVTKLPSPTDSYALEQLVPFSSTRLVYSPCWFWFCTGDFVPEKFPLPLSPSIHACVRAWSIPFYGCLDPVLCIPDLFLSALLLLTSWPSQRTFCCILTGNANLDDGWQAELHRPVGPGG
eukprot:6183728-Pleurochrysis_carterae.AAC.1